AIAKRDHPWCGQLISRRDARHRPSIDVRIHETLTLRVPRLHSLDISSCAVHDSSTTFSSRGGGPPPGSHRNAVLSPHASDISCYSAHPTPGVTHGRQHTEKTRAHSPSARLDRLRSGNRWSDREERAPVPDGRVG